jgi:ABC-type multidrug transport system ATPase subunit
VNPLPSEPPRSPLLVARGARIAVDDAVAIEAFDLETHGRALLVLGDSAPLCATLGNAPLGMASAWWAARAGRLEPVMGHARVAAGRLELAGRDVATGAHRAILGYAPLDPPLPLDTTVSAWLDEVLELASGLAGHALPAATRAGRVAELVLRVGLVARSATPIRALGFAERRALVLAQAVVAAPSVLVAEAPLAGLDEASAAFVLSALATASEGRATIVSVSRPLPGTPEGVLATRASDVAVLAGGQLVHAGSASELLLAGRVLRLHVPEGAEALAQALARRGASLRGGPTRFVVELPEGVGPTEVLLDAAEVSASVVEVAKLM